LLIAALCFGGIATASRCGDGVVDAGEQCDKVGNAFPACCDPSTCLFFPATQICRPSASTCDAAETCTGSSSDCPGDSPAPINTLCRPAALGGCDTYEVCDGVSFTCPPDVFLPAGQPCINPNAQWCDRPSNVCPGNSAICPLVVTDCGDGHYCVCHHNNGKSEYIILCFKNFQGYHQHLTDHTDDIVWLGDPPTKRPQFSSDCYFANSGGSFIEDGSSLEDPVGTTSATGSSLTYIIVGVVLAAVVAVGAAVGVAVKIYRPRRLNVAQLPVVSDITLNSV